MNKSQFVTTGIILLLATVGMWLYFLFTPVITQEGGAAYYLRPGATNKLVITELAEQGLVTHPLLFSIYVYPYRNAQLKTGEYLFPKGSTPVSIWKQITTGVGLVYHPFAIIPGWTFMQLRKALSQTQGLRQTLNGLSDHQIMTRLGNSDLAPEGEFFPETYYYTRGIPDFVILKRAYALMQKQLSAAWLKRAPNLPYKDAYEALIAASLIEKEAYLNAERPVIAGVLINRLRKDMLLQFDPTVIYGMGERYAGKIHKENLQEDTPYNSYIHKGLPPTPIAMPGLASIDAALHPQDNDYIYFVAKGDGGHQFSKTLSEHNKAVDAAIKKQSGQELLK